MVSTVNFFATASGYECIQNVQVTKQERLHIMMGWRRVDGTVSIALSAGPLYHQIAVAFAAMPRMPALCQEESAPGDRQEVGGESPLR